MDEQLVGRVTHYYSRLQVAVVEVTDSDLRVGDTIRVLGSISNFTQQVESMEIDHAPDASNRLIEHGRKPTVVMAVSLTALSCITWMRGLLVYRPQLCCRCVWN